MDGPEEIFTQIKALLLPYEKYFNVKTDYANRYELEGKGEYEVTSLKTGKTAKKRNPYFIGIIVQSNYVGLYSTSVYTDKKDFEAKVPELLSHLKGKSCFHIKKLKKNTLSNIKKAIEFSYQSFKKKGWT